ncbi:MAG: DUF928 domain-containing protein [Synechococcales bacterium]|nr:DUF928 domain-containing protein [Synechococcales bacterium]
MMTRLKELIQKGLLTLLLGVVAASLLLVPLFPVSPHYPATHWLTPVAYAQGSVLAPLTNLLERTGLYTPNRKGTAPRGRRVGGAGRGPICALPESESSDQIKALMPFKPVTNPGDNSVVQDVEAGTETEEVGGLTIAPQPTFWFYIPYISTPETPPKRVAQFVLLDESDRPVWNELMTIELRDRPRLVEYSLPHSLNIETLYSWYFSVICDADKLSRNPTVRGWIQRTEPTPELQAALREVSRFDQHVAYANTGFWFDMVSSLVNTRRQFPFVHRDDWTMLLNHFGIPAANQFDVLESAEPADREVVRGNQLPARI